MPIHMNKDSKGYYYQWGNQHKYYFNPKSERSMDLAYRKVLKQVAAIFYSRAASKALAQPARSLSQRDK